MADIPVRSMDEVFAVCRFMDAFPRQWWIGGGWAIDLWAGGPSRDHEDIEICVLRDAQEAVHTYCPGWQYYTPVDGQWAPMPEHERLAFPNFMLQLRRTPGTAVAIEGMPPQFEFLLNDVVDGEWIYGPEPSIRLPLERVFVRSPLGPLVTAPEILLLHKAWYTHRPKDNHDFERVRNLLDADQRGWLRTQLKRIRPDDPWLSRL